MMMPLGATYSNLILFIFVICHLNYIAAQNITAERLKEIFDYSPTITTASPEDCQCVSHGLCRNTNIEGLIDIRTSVGRCPSYIEYCCPIDDIIDQSDLMQKSAKNQIDSCGVRNTDGVMFRIMESDGEANFGEFPWMVAILKEQLLDDNIISIYKCGGSLIHPQVVLTAAHCVNNREDTLIARAGEWDSQTTKEILKHQDRRVKSVIIHPQFYAGALHYDVALLFLDQPFTSSQHIGLVCLPKQGAVPASNTRCWAAGWGKDKFDVSIGAYQAIMKKIELPFMDENTCQSRLRTTRLGRYFRLHESFVCAGGEANKDTCKGDGGSPLVCPIDGNSNRYEQVGIVAWGIGCGEKGIPGVYGNVAFVRDWIDAKMRLNHFSTAQYSSP